jgi:hypothetical protein
MPKIKIKDLPKGQKISKAELKKIKGGYSFYSASPLPIPYTANYSFFTPIVKPGGTVAV